MKYTKLLILSIILLCGNILLAQTGADTINTKKITRADLEKMSLEELMMLDFEDEEMRLMVEQLLNRSIETTERGTSKQKADNVPATVITFTDYEIQMRGYNSLWDIIADLPGFKTDYSVTQTAFNRMTWRGVVGMDKFIILIDGVRASSPTNEDMPFIENYPLAFAKQIEIVYGPASALYGADAFTGVINIITKRAEDLEKGAEVKLSTEMYGRYLANLTVGRKISDDIEFTFSGQYMHDEQPDLSKFYEDDYREINSLYTGTFVTSLTNNAGENIVMRPEESIVPKYELPLHAYAIHSSLKVKDFRASFFRNEARTPTAAGQPPNNAVYNRNNFVIHRVNMGNLIYNKTFNKLTSTSMAIYSTYELDPKSGFRNLYTEMERSYKFARGRMFQLEQLLRWDISDRFALTTGITYQDFFSSPKGHDLESPVTDVSNPRGTLFNTIQPNNPEGIEADIPRLFYSNTGGFVQADFSPIPDYDLFLTVGARYDYNTRFSGTFNPRFGIVWRPKPKLSIKGMFGSAFLAPSPLAAYEQFGSFVTNDEGTSYGSAFFRLPNPDLEPQRIQTSELSIKTYFNDALSLTLTGYYSRVTGLITTSADEGRTGLYNYDPAAGNYNYKGFTVDFVEIQINQGQQNIYGGTLQLDYFQNFGATGRFGANIALSYVEGSVDEDDSGNSKELGLITPLMLKGGIDLKVGNFYIAPRFAYFNEQRVNFTTNTNTSNTRQTIDGYFLTNLQVGYSPAEDLRLFVYARNLFDARYRNPTVSADPETGVVNAIGEFANGAPQNPFRLGGGIMMTF